MCGALQAAVQMAADWDKAHARVVDALEALGAATAAAAAAGLGGDDDANSKTICTHQAATPTPSLPAREE
jgi:hypothetical protein